VLYQIHNVINSKVEQIVAYLMDEKTQALDSRRSIMQAINSVRERHKETVVDDQSRQIWRDTIRQFFLPQNELGLSNERKLTDRMVHSTNVS